MSDDGSALTNEYPVRESKTPGTVVVPPPWRTVALQELCGDRVVFATIDDLLNDPSLGRDVVAIATDRQVDASLLDLPRIQIISFSGTGVWDLVDTETAADRGIAVCNIRGYASDAVAEHTWALILAVTRRIVQADNAVRAGLWPSPPWGRGLSQRTLGLLGVGSIGERVAELGCSFGMDIVAWSARGAGAALREGTILRYTSKDEVLRTSDVISVHARYESGVAPLLGESELSCLKRGAVVVNTARGGLIDGAALSAALVAGHIAGAGLDVFECEPLASDSPLRSAPNVMFTPHVAAATPETQAQARKQCLENITAYLAGRPRNVVNGR